MSPSRSWLIGALDHLQGSDTVLAALGETRIRLLKQLQQGENVEKIMINRGKYYSFYYFASAVRPKWNIPKHYDIYVFNAKALQQAKNIEKVIKHIGKHYLIENALRKRCYDSLRLHASCRCLFTNFEDSVFIGRLFLRAIFQKFQMKSYFL